MYINKGVLYVIKEIKIRKNSFESEILLFNDIYKLKRLNILFGGNGVGKTILLNGIKNRSLELKTDKEIHILSYSNSVDNFRKIDKPCYKNTGNALLQKIHANSLSEGQSIIYTLMSFLEYVKSFAESEDKTIVVLLDEIDSGLSAENINMVIHLLIEMLNNYSNLQFFISSNHYHFIYVFKEVLNMYNGEFVRIESYDKYFEILSKEMISLGTKRKLSFLESANYEL